MDAWTTAAATPPEGEDRGGRGRGGGDTVDVDVTADSGRGGGVMLDVTGGVVLPLLENDWFRRGGNATVSSPPLVPVSAEGLVCTGDMPDIRFAGDTAPEITKCKIPAMIDIYIYIYHVYSTMF